MSVNWILSQITPVEDGECELNHLYEAYKLDMQSDTVIGKKHFVDYIYSFFPKIKKIRRRLNGSNLSIYRGIQLNTNFESKQPLDLNNIKDYMPSSFELKSVSSETIEIQQDSGSKCNGNTVFKVLSIYRNGTFTVTISGKKVDLTKLHIDASFQLDKRGLETVFKVFKSIKLCSGLRYNKSMIVGRFHTLDTWTCSQESFKSLRTLSCLKAVPITSHTSTCRVCQQQFFQQTKENSKENVSPEPVDSTIQRLFPSAPPKMVAMLAEQAKNVGRTPKGRRWSEEFIATCLQLYIRSPKCYELLKNSQIMVLPSPSRLILYKNSLNQEPGFDSSVFLWMHEEANRLGISDDKRIGGIIFDEMCIQEDIQIEKKGSNFELIGFVELGEEGQLCQNLKTASKNKTMGTHILQLLFLGLNGFRFPFAHFVTDNIQATQLYGLFFKALYLLREFGFKAIFTCMDGAQCNRNFLHICLGDKPSKFICPIPFTSYPIIFIMDISHVLKKIRNNIKKSGIHQKCTRLITLPNSLQVQWQMFVDFFHWDQQNALQCHRKLTREHIFPDKQLQMRNQLAFDMLDSTMLNSIVRYKDSLGEKGKVLDGLIEFLQNTSQLVNIFQDRRPITNLSDARLQQLKDVDDWFTQWEENTAQEDKRKSLMSAQCHEDIHSSIRGFIDLCEIVIDMKTPVPITPALVNSDVIENIFNQQRSTYNGANTNPNALQYRKTINSILLGENTISKKANASRSLTAKPFPLTVKKPVKKRMSSHQNEGESIQSIKVIRM